MSIAIHTHSTTTSAGRFVRTISAERGVLSRNEQLRGARGLMRHFVLAFAVAGAGIYAVTVTGLTI